MGCTNSELWNNLGLCCFYASQYDMTVRCFENALMVADDLAQADIWCAEYSTQKILHPIQPQIQLLNRLVAVLCIQVQYQPYGPGPW